MRGIEITGVIIDDVMWSDGPQGPWEPYFAWRPRQDIHGAWHWLGRIYRRERNRMVYPSQGWEYGTVFDVLRDR
jgi:hypothetical protein